MKLALASAAFHHVFERGDLTQLEFLDLCARELACDVVLDVRHFPRTDDDYLAQIKKMATDLGIGVAAVSDADFFSSGEARSLEIARAVGAPLLCSHLAFEAEHPWSWQIERIDAATSRAKSANVTLAVRNVPGTLAAGAADCKRLAKEADSAWLRFGLEPLAFGSSDDIAPLVGATVLLWQSLERSAPAEIEATSALFAQFRGAIVLDAARGDADPEKAASALRSWRRTLASRELNRT